jgi:hypothetical protein
VEIVTKEIFDQPEGGDSIESDEGIVKNYALRASLEMMSMKRSTSSVRGGTRVPQLKRSYYAMQQRA